MSDEINGRREGYVQAIEHLFGSLPLFLRSALMSQKQPKNLPEQGGTTKGEKKALFRELGGLDYLQIYADNSEDCVKILNDEINAEKTKTLQERERLITEYANQKEAVANTLAEI